MMTKTFKSLFYLLVLVSTPCSAQWSDSFDDGDFKQNQNWNGDTTNFEVNTSLQLHLNAPAVAEKSYLFTHSAISTGAVWKFWTELDFNPSSGNYAKVYLMSNNQRLDTALNGYYLRIGYTNDDISLFRQDGNTSKLIIDGRDGMLAKTINKVSIQVKRSFAGEWEISCDSTGLANLSVLGSAIDTTYWTSSYFGIQCVYTATRSNKFLFDNFEVTGKSSNDTIVPKLQSCKVLNDSILQAEFTEEIIDTSLQNPANYSLSSGYSIKNIKTVNSKEVEVLLNTAIPCKQKVNIYFKNLRDNSGNSITDTTVQFSFCPGTLYDVLISEIMADPDPPIYLPNREYVELYNKGGVSLDLNSWTLKVGADLINFPETKLPADSFLIITTSKGCAEFGNRLCADILPTYSLNNSQENVQLIKKSKKLIHWIAYDDTWYQDELKRTGGWSLEMIDTNSPCIQKENWRASVNNLGGTPGQVNSVSGTVKDNASFNYEQIYLPNDSTIRVYFSKPIISENIISSMFSTEPERKPARIVVDDISHSFIDIIYSSPFVAGTPYKLHLTEDISDCSGNKLTAAEIPFMKPSLAEPNDILINEVMFDALIGKQEFIELYNNSDKYINSNNIKIAYKSPSASYNSALELSGKPFLIAPHSFIVCVQSKKGISEQYYIPDVKIVVENKDLPNLNNEEGCIAIMNRQLEVLEEFCYSSKMHFSLATNVSGVSLERIKYKGLSSDNSNWHSASSTAEYATPGAVNSQFLDESEASDEITLEYEIFSPDNDGYKDFETINYKFDKPDFVANILVFDASGRRIRIIANNQLLGSQGSFIWDGVDEKGKLAQTGIDLIYIKLHNPSGEIKEYRKTCVLGGEMKR
jgi:hypothetical protein